MKRWLLILIVVVAVGVGAYAGVRGWRYYERHRKVYVPVESNVAVTNGTVNNQINVNLGLNENINANSNHNVSLPAEVNLAAPFTSQAPLVNWDAEHEEFCEEASILMAARALQGRTIKDANDAENALQQIKDWEMEHFLGVYESTTALQTSRIVTGLYSLSAELLSNPTVDQLKRELAAGHFIVVPAAGRELHNPNFKQPGPLYHMLLLKGYTKDDEFITNDPGTRNGRNYVYKTSVLMNAIHDWNNGDVMNGQSVVIVISAPR
jgi:hypothetical protein